MMAIAANDPTFSKHWKLTNVSENVGTNIGSFAPHLPNRAKKNKVVLTKVG